MLLPTKLRHIPVWWAVRFVCLSLALSPGPSTVPAHSKCSLLAGEWTIFTSSPGPLPWTHQAPSCPSAPGVTLILPTPKPAQICPSSSPCWGLPSPSLSNHANMSKTQSGASSRQPSQPFSFHTDFSLLRVPLHL